MTLEKWMQHRMGGPLTWRWPAAASVAVAWVSALGGCTTTTTPAKSTGPNVKLCEAIKLNGWQGEKNQNQWFLKVGDINYVFSAADKGSRNDTDGPVKNVHWVLLDAMSVGRATSKRVPTMVYNPAEAVLNVNGRDVRALPHLWTAEFVKDRFHPGHSLPVPQDLNAGGSTSKRYYMAFPVNLAPHDTYRLSPGSLALDGQRVALPVLGSCIS